MSPVRDCGGASLTFNKNDFMTNDFTNNIVGSGVDRDLSLTG